MSKTREKVTHPNPIIWRPELKSRGLAECIRPCTDWDQATHRYPNPIGEWRWKHATACNVWITGTVIIQRSECWWKRGQIEFVGDGEPNTLCPCLIRVDGMGRPIGEADWAR